MKLKVDQNKQNGFGAILNIIGNIIFIFGFFYFLSSFDENIEIPTIFNLLGVYVQLSVLIITILLGLAFKIPGKILLLLADIEFNTRASSNNERDNREEN